jgi:hypothetical protein
MFSQVGAPLAAGSEKVWPMITVEAIISPITASAFALLPKM